MKHFFVLNFTFLYEKYIYIAFSSGMVYWIKVKKFYFYIDIECFLYVDCGVYIVYIPTDCSIQPVFVMYIWYMYIVQQQYTSNN